jgi:hypothetical protein
MLKISDTFYPGLRIYLTPAGAIILLSIIIFPASPNFYECLELNLLLGFAPLISLRSIVFLLGFTYL